MKQLMFICLGNICRSPLAHAVFDHYVQAEGLSDRILTESSGTGASHAGEQADYRMRQTARDHGVTLNHISRRLKVSDIKKYDLLLTMDQHNYHDTLRLCRSAEEQSKVVMFRDYDPEGPGDVPDPWYGGMGGFENVWHIVNRTCKSLLEQVR